jgi:predicted phage terminase large subunit-like protein
MEDSSAKDEFRTTEGGIVYATGAEGSITGRGAGKMRGEFGGAVIIDDPHKAGEATSSVMRQNVIDWYQNTIRSRLNKQDTPIIVIMQRLHEADLAGWLLNGGTGESWRHVSIPARDPQGRSFWPEQFPDDMLDRLETSSPYVFAGQYMQHPAPLGGGIFKDEWWRFLEVPPLTKHRAIYADTAQKTKEQNDFSVFQCWGQTIDGQIVLLDQVRGKWEAPELETMARAFWAKHHAIQNAGPLRAFKVEDKVSGTGLIQKLKREGIPIIPIQRNIDKVTRAMDAAPYVQSGNVIIMRNLAHLVDFMSEASVFPNGAHDDMIDAAMSAISDMTAPQAAPAIRAL